jgi:hypothetical protein
VIEAEVIGVVAKERAINAVQALQSSLTSSMVRLPITTGLEGAEHKLEEVEKR